MLHLATADSLGPLVRELADILEQPPDDPLTPEWVAVPTAGMKRWLSLELAHTLGASDSRLLDGVTANVDFAFPGALRQTLLEADPLHGARDPWHIDRLVWAVLDVLHQADDDAVLKPLTRLALGTTRFGVARRAADLFDRYIVRRPELLEAWSGGNDVDTLGRQLEDHDRWQPHLWRLTSDWIGQPSPVDRIPQLLDAARNGELDLQLPERLSFFGLTSLPGGVTFLDLATAIASTRDVHLLLIDPSSATTTTIADSQRRPGKVSLLRGADDSFAVVQNPLLGSWGRPYRERALVLRRGLLEDHPCRHLRSEEGSDHSGPSLLRRIQEDIRSNIAPAATFELTPDDRSIQIHECYGDVRQAEVIRDVILHLLSIDRELKEEDIVVCCPAIESFAPLIESAFGPSASHSEDGSNVARPSLNYRIADRALRDTNAVIAALDSLLDLVSGRMTAAEVAEFCALPPVRDRFDFDDNDLDLLRVWISQFHIHWGFDGAQRSSWGLPPEYEANSWRSMLDRLLVGAAITDDNIELGLGDIAPHGIEGDTVEFVGRIADLLTRIDFLGREFARPRTIASWCGDLIDVAHQLFAVPNDQQWQVDELRTTLEEVAEASSAVRGESEAPLTINDIRRLLGDHLASTRSAPNFFRGGITVTSLTPLRWIPYRVLCVLGLERTETPSGLGIDGDDLAGRIPHVGDPDPHAEGRQALLDALLSARDYLIITVKGHDVATNASIPRTTCHSDLLDTIAETVLDHDGRNASASITTHHPRHSYDARCFVGGALGIKDPWSFDKDGLLAAHGRSDRQYGPSEFLSVHLPPKGDDTYVTADQLVDFHRHPVRYFFRHRLQVEFPRGQQQIEDDLSTHLEGLDRWTIASKMLDARRHGRDSASTESYIRSLGILPPGVAGAAALEDLSSTVDELINLAHHLDLDLATGRTVDIACELPDGLCITGQELDLGSTSNRSVATISVSRERPAQHLEAWIRLLAVTATDPSTAWRSISIRPNKRGKPAALQLRSFGHDATSRRAIAYSGLEVAVDCYRRGLLEPLPLFSQLSLALFSGHDPHQSWQPFASPGARQDAALVAAFGSYTLEDLLNIPAREDDPAGNANARAQRYADYLWSAVGATCEEVH